MHERIILAVDTSEKRRAEEIADMASAAGTRLKLGLELSSAHGWHYCSQLADKYDLDWVADAKLDDIPNTVVGAVRNICRLERPPFGITMHTLSGREAMERAQLEAEAVKMLGVTILTSLKYDEILEIYSSDPKDKVVQLAESAASAGLAGIVASPQEVGLIKSNPKTKHLYAMIPGTRSVGAESHDQGRTATPGQAVKDGADLLVIGRQITQAENPAGACQSLLKELETDSLF